MATIYIAYGSVEGQTAHIAEYIAEVIRAHGHQAETADLKHSADTIPAGQDGVIVAASVHVGKHEGYVADFVRKNRGDLETLSSALVSVSLAAHGDEASAEGYVESSRRRPAGIPARSRCFPVRSSTPSTTSSSAS
ncbi:flavodoxin domain-containing protein [Pseudarthrobacter sp. NPDC092184]|uniref:flavodoxin domain-containing protein n=1 Tax=unclassified Pseudarthrobacter TaxID=2647000 RepID=UPI003820C9E6